MAGSAGDAPPAPKRLVDFQNDVTVSDILLAAREGFHSIEHVKRYTTMGMAPIRASSQHERHGIVADALGKTIPEIGLTTFRPPYTPVTFGTIAGHARGDCSIRSARRHRTTGHEAHGAVFEDVGHWKRARYFPQDRRGHARRRWRANAWRSRNSVGILDASTLGKIEVEGPDAANF